MFIGMQFLIKYQDCVSERPGQSGPEGAHVMVVTGQPARQVVRGVQMRSERLFESLALFGFLQGRFFPVV